MSGVVSANDRVRDEAAQDEQLEGWRGQRGVVVLWSDADGRAINRRFDGQEHFAWRYTGKFQRPVMYRCGCLCGWRGSWCDDWSEAQEQGLAHEGYEVAS